MTERRIPGVLWIAIGFMAFATFGKLLASIKVGPIVLVDAAVCALLTVGLYRGQRWAYFLTIVIVPLKLIVAVAMGRFGAAISVFALDCLVLIPVLVCTSYFLGQVCRRPDCRHRNPIEARYCAKCGDELNPRASDFEHRA